MLDQKKSPSYIKHYDALFKCSAPRDLGTVALRCDTVTKILSTVFYHYLLFRYKIVFN